MNRFIVDLLSSIWFQTIFISLISGGIVAIMSYLYRLKEQDDLKKKLRIYVYVEINQLQSHIQEIKDLLFESKDDWFRTQPGTGIELVFFNNSKIKEALIDLDEEETLLIVSYYKFYLGVESKLKTFAKHLQKKLQLQKELNLQDHSNISIISRNILTEEIHSYEELLIECTRILEKEFELIESTYKEIVQTEEFIYVKEKYKLTIY